MSQPLWTTEALARALNGRLTGPPAAALTDISIDSRTIGKGEAFFAGKQQFFGWRLVSGDDDLIKERAGAFGDVDVTVVDGIKRAGIECAHHVVELPFR